MGQRSNANNAAMKDVQIELRREGCALDMEHRLNTNDAEVKEGCTNLARKGGVCMRHGAYRNPR